MIQDCIEVGNEVDSFVVPIILSTVDEFGSVCTFTLKTLLDTGSPINLIKLRYVHDKTLQPTVDSENFTGINGSQLVVLGIYETEINLKGVMVRVKFHVVPDSTISYGALLGRSFMSQSGLDFKIIQGTPELKVVIKDETPTDFDRQLMLIDSNVLKNDEFELNVHPQLNTDERIEVEQLINDHLKREKSDEPTVSYEASIKLEDNHKEYHFKPRRLAEVEKIQLQKIIDDLLTKGVIRESESPYASPIVLVRKKTGDVRLCVDFREMNKYVIKDRFPLPLIEDQLDQLRQKQVYTKLDLKSAFHHIKLSEESTKFTSFITPGGQYEFLRLPFGYCNSPSVFTRYINKIFKPLLDQKKICVFIDDVLIATDTMTENVAILREVLKIINDNLLELRLDKCVFMSPEITYLGYCIDKNGISPSKEHLESVSNFPVPRNAKEVHSFVGLTSYFRKFVRNFSIIAKPLYNLLKKNVQFHFGSEETLAFETLKRRLCESPVLSVYSPSKETELHCDASAQGFGAILLQRQDDDKFHPVAYFSKRSTEPESKYHSYELECLAIIYALKRFHVYLYGLNFKIVTDCHSLQLTLNKKEINPRISRWALVLQQYNYVVEHRSGKNMVHVDALSRCKVMVIEPNSFEQNLALQQMQDSAITGIREQLETTSLPFYELRNGLVYRKHGDDLLFYVPSNMEHHILKLYHDEVGHRGPDKVRDLITKSYWFPKLMAKIKTYISNCLQCLAYSPSTHLKRQGYLHCVPKGDRPFETLHVDHYGPLESTTSKNKYIFEVIDGFSKFVKYYPCKNTNTKEVLKHLQHYFDNYSRPRRIIHDRGSCFTSQNFMSFLEERRIESHAVASGCPKANGQIERVNRDITPMLAKISPVLNKWDTMLSTLEFVCNNTKNRSTKFTPSEILFGVSQRGIIDDPLREYLEDWKDTERDLEGIRKEAAQNILVGQEYNKKYFDKKRTPAKSYQVGDLIMVSNVDTSVGTNKKLIPKFKGPYAITEVLNNDRYKIADVDGFQITQTPFRGIFDVTRIKPWLSPCKSLDPYELN